MAENNIQIGDTYDLSKNIKEIEVNTGFILGLEKVLFFFITEVIEDQTSIEPMFKKFQSLLQGEVKPEELEFTELETNIYTIFALQQLLRAKAFEQKLVTPNKAVIEKDLNKELFESYLSRDVKRTEEVIEKIKKSLS